MCMKYKITMLTATMKNRTNNENVLADKIVWRSFLYLDFLFLA